MKKIFNIELGSNVAFYNNAGSRRVEGSDRKDGSFLSRKMYYTNASHSGKVVKIKGHNGSSARIYLDNGQEIEIGYGTHYHLNGDVCANHWNKYDIVY